MISGQTFGDAFGAALRDTWPALRSWIWWLVPVVLVSMAGLVVVGILNAPSDLPASGEIWQVEAACAIAIPFTVAAFFSLAGAVRTVRPDFRMTVRRFFGVIGWSLAASLIVMLGLVCLIVPGLYLLVKLGFTPYFYLLDESPGNQMATAWRRTRGAFWYTALMIFASGAIFEAVSYAGGFVLGGLAAISRPAALIALPVLFVVFFAALQFQYNAYMRWADALLTATPA